MAKATKLKQASAPRQPGEMARLKIVQGPDYGSVYIITASKVTIGRGDENDIVISDLKASRVHASITFTERGWNIQDLGSSNGLLHNGAPARSGALGPSDTVTLGETTLELISADLGTKMLAAPPRSSNQIQLEQAAFAAQRERIRGISGKKSGLKQPGASLFAKISKNPKMLVAAVAVFGVLFLIEPDTTKAPVQQKKPPAEARDIASYLPGSDLSVMSKSAEVFFKAGFREYRERNYLRARMQFETVLQVAPGHPLARLYLDNCNKEIEEEVRFHLETGKKSMEAGKLRDARGHFQAITRLLFRDQTNPALAEAKEQLEKLRKTSQGEGT